MAHLFDRWPEVESRIRGKKIILFLDYDGTLAPIVKDPARAAISQRQRNLIRDTSMEPFIKVAVVSGRELGDVKRKVKIPRLTYAGNHGLELEGPKVRYVHAGADALRPVMKHIARDLEKSLAEVPGLWVEDKKFTLSVHYRRVPGAWVRKAKKKFREVFRKWSRKYRIVVTEGKKVWEIRPAVAWDKSRIVRWLLRHFKADRSVVPIYIGDDVTDENAFRSVRREGLGVRVTENPRKPTAAGFRLKSPSEVYLFLRRLRGMKAR